MRELCAKAGGASRCLVSRARVDAARITIPEAIDYRTQRARILSGGSGAEPGSAGRSPRA